MKIITNKDKCEALIGSLNDSILNAYSYKRLLNEFYQPDDFIFIEHDDDVLPLVSKHGLATFYGGTTHNAATRLPTSPPLINEALRHLSLEGYRFQFVSISNDVFPYLSPEHKQYDVPYKVEWHHHDIRRYNPEILKEGCTGKKLWSWKRIFRKKDSYTFVTIDFETLERRFDELMKAHNAYFQERDKASVWSGTESLLLQILANFSRHHQLFIRLILKDDEPRALYTIVYTTTEMIYYFGGSMNHSDQFVSKIMYLDMLEQTAIIARASGSSVESLNGLAGAFTNKPVFGFSPKPLYALVKDPNWIIRPDPDIEPTLYYKTYGRRFGIENFQ